MTRIPRLDVLDRRAVCAIAGAAFVCGFLLASVVPNALRLKYPMPVAVPAMAYTIGEQFCKDWSKLAYLVPLGESLYTFQCHKHARYEGIKIHTKP